MDVAPTVAMGPLADGSISNFARNISKYLCTNFGAFIKKCSIDQLIRSTIGRYNNYTIILLTKTTAAQNEDALSYRRVRGL